MYVQTEIMFPPQAIPRVREAAGPLWQNLVDRVVPLDEAHPEKLALILTLIRLDGCLDCETDSFRAMRGCDLCAQQTLRKFRKNEEALMALYAQALGDVQAFLAQRPAGAASE